MHIDLIIESENVFTGTDAATRPAAVAISGDRIVAVGPRADVHAFARARNEGPAPEVRDFGDALVVPGFHDSHLHFFHSAVYASPLATMFLGENEADCVERMRAFAAERPNGWLLAQGWREYRWDPPVLPSKRSLDEAFPARPVALYSGDAHTLWLNSAALAELGLTRDSVPPAGGSYDRDEAGELTGIVREAAAMELMPQIMGSFTDEEVASAYRGFFARLGAFGVTSVCDMSLMAHPGLDFIRDDVHAALLERGELTARVHLFPTLTGDMGRFETMRALYTGPCLQATGFKQFFDGVSSQHTAWVTEPYANARAEGDCGRPTVDAAVMRSLVLAAAERGYPVRIHTIGDAAIHAALDIFEEARATYGPLPEGRRNCLEHLENFLPEDLGRLAELQVVAAVQPPHMTLDPGGPERDLGPGRVPYMWPLRTLLDRSTVLAFGTDSPVVDVNSMDVLYSAVTRQDPGTHEPAGGWLPDERIGRAEALRAYTQGSAAAAGRRRELGTLETGKLADIAVLDRNLLACDPEDIQKTKVLATFMGGRCVFER
ncbi:MULTISPECIES: amidohydrolase [Gordonibacter]|uniref:Amidohydrolase n=4 Tax=Gordonibacter TaxID=644652 RepID=A0A369LSL0_9ACTN|nr:MULTISPECIES: amidohydrolase [Gordonibacter]MCB6313737.1 amidohydrolase [Gordonibacter pamelaeae]MSA63085.1 amidohydrolase family protein [Gordonibacter pamelaeae]MSA96200.1 amidohydrolase family protein [Gordonibacter urolithinfaciens]RDB61629.1 amidohydrolase [Gordonibacter pamelaeae]